MKKHYPIKIALKKCSGCGNKKSRQQFNQDKRKGRDLFAYCKLCQKEYRRGYYLMKFK